MNEKIAKLAEQSIGKNKGINRSLINPVYADNFVKHIVIDYVDLHDYDRIELKYD